MLWKRYAECRIYVGARFSRSYVLMFLAQGAEANLLCSESYIAMVCNVGSPRL